MIMLKRKWNDCDVSIEITITYIVAEEDFDFSDARYEIDGEIYTEWSPKLEETIRKIEFFNKIVHIQ